MTWDKYLKEGFEKYELFQGEPVTAEFVQGQYGLQLQLEINVTAIEEPAGAELPPRYTLWFSIGDTKGREGWQLSDGSLWNGKEDAAIAKSSNLGKLMERCMELNAPIVNQPLPPSDKNAWLTLGSCIWKLEDVERRGLEPSQITLPIQVVGAGVPAPVHMNGNGNSVAPPPVMTPPTANMTDYAAHWGANDTIWRNYIKSIAVGKSREAAKEALMKDNFVQSDSVLMNGLDAGTFWQWATSVSLMVETGGVLV